MNLSNQTQELFGKRYEAERANGVFTFSKRWKTPMTYVFAPSIIAFNIALIYFMWKVVMKSFTAMDTSTLFGLLSVFVLVGLPFASYGFLLAYYALVSFANKTVLRAGQEGISVSNEPVSFNLLGHKSFRIPAERIAAIEVRTDEEEEYGDTNYGVVVRETDDYETRLYLFPDREQAEFIVREMRQNLPQPEETVGAV